MDEKNKAPDFVKERIDVKAETILSFAHAIGRLKAGAVAGISLAPDTNILMMTSFGFVEGEIETFEGEPKTASAAMSKALFGIRNDDFVNMQEHGRNTVTNNSSIITVRDAKITYYASPQNPSRIAELFLFSDQIIGFTYGNKSIG